MSISRVCTMSLAALAGFVSTGMMQAAPQAKFHLSVTAHWGQAVLRPGDYSVSLPVPSIGNRGLQIVGAGQTILEFPLTVQERSNTNHSYLQLTQVGGSYFVREFSSGAAGQVFVFSVPKLKP